MNSGASSFGVEAVVTVDSKGQIVLPKGLRERAGFKPNGKIGLISFEKEGEIFCIIMIKAESLGDAVTETLSQIAQGLR
jgi:AbrB family looped-hinge helix DNA binding protein